MIRSDLEESKRLVTMACRIMNDAGLVEGFGHVSVRLGASDRILLTPQKALGLVRPYDLIIVNGDGECLEGQQASVPLEAYIHTEIYKRRQDINAICRSHPLFAGVIGVLKKELRPVHGFGAFLGVRIPVFDKSCLITTPGLGRELADALGYARAVILRGNGVVVTGTNLEEACILSLFLEESCRMFYLAQMQGSPTFMDEREIEARLAYKENELRRAWDYYINKYVGSANSIV